MRDFLTQVVVCCIYILKTYYVIVVLTTFKRVKKFRLNWMNNYTKLLSCGEPSENHTVNNVFVYKTIIIMLLLRALNILTIIT